MMHRNNRNKSEVLFAYYLKNMNSTNTSLKPSSDRFSHIYNSQDVSLSDYMKIDSVIKQISVENSWPEDQLKSDLTILIKNRIYTVKDLRVLSKESWERIELLPIVKDLLREAISRGYVNPVSGEILVPNDMNDNIIKKETSKPLPISNDEKLQMKSQKMQSNLFPNEKPTLFSPPSNKKVDENRMKVKTTNGKIYEVDRWCPHAKTDLSARGIVIGSKLFCMKHNWSFDLENKGVCSGNAGNASINACLVNDW
ncbi:8911_t:CDS:2 [Diversispora eburnea]|uniref:8911_t:CDS:1 n=1 Tax=Diversispora eburnea TaxID=1213867 RepID=A0A9N8VX18_9GLOM|nr:8911_t:CDS:2 [Diversispora eburnea]